MPLLRGSPTHKQMQKNVPFIWDQKCQDSLNLANKPISTYLS